MAILLSIQKSLDNPGVLQKALGSKEEDWRFLACMKSSFFFVIECYYIHLHLLLHTLSCLQFHKFTLLTHKYCYILYLAYSSTNLLYLHISTIFTHSFTYTYTNATITWKKLNTSLHLVTGKKIIIIEIITYLLIKHYVSFLQHTLFLFN